MIQDSGVRKSHCIGEDVERILCNDTEQLQCIIREKGKFVNGIAFFTGILYNHFVTEDIFAGKRTENEMLIW